MISRLTSESQRLFALVILLTLPVSLLSAEDIEKEAPVFSLGTRPFVVVTAASANRLRDDAALLFDAAGMPDVVDTVLDKLDENVQGLEGLNWDRPAGIMVFLNSVFPPSFEFVAFLPISDMERFQSMMELGTAVMKEDTEVEGRYELITPRRNLQIQIQGEYALIQLPMMDPDPAFDREIPAPDLLVAGLTNQFDVAVSLDVEAVPKATRDLILNLLVSTMSTQIQQRDEEPESQYQIRKSWMEADIQAFRLLFDECRRISFGIDIVEEERVANIDVLVEVREATQLLEEIFASSTKPSYFTPLLSDSSPLSLSWSAVVAERDRERYVGVLEGLKGELSRVVEEQDLGTVPEEGSPLYLALDALQQTAREGHLDVFGQMYRDSNNKLAVVGAIRLEDGEAIAGGLADLLTRLLGKDTIGEIETAFSQHADITFHRIRFRNPDAGALELFGGDPGIIVGAGPRSGWICIGGEDSFDTLKSVMDELAAAYENPIEREIPASLRLVLRVNDLIELVQGAEAAKKEANAAAEVPTEEVVPATTAEAQPGQRPSPANRRDQFRRRREESNKLMQEALAEGDDEIRVEARPIDNGMRIRVRLQEGFLRGVGRIIGQRIAGN
ncbi:MAG: hypothetical protein KDA81_21865 [Planctomycetaceae bacterium]|nr:hypothetical protein [Planctomycetaceae bacterium]